MKLWVSCQFVLWFSTFNISLKVYNFLISLPNLLKLFLIGLSDFSASIESKLFLEWTWPLSWNNIVIIPQWRRLCVREWLGPWWRALVLTSYRTCYCPSSLAVHWQVDDATGASWEGSCLPGPPCGETWSPWPSCRWSPQASAGNPSPGLQKKRNDKYLDGHYWGVFHKDPKLNISLSWTSQL